MLERSTNKNRVGTNKNDADEDDTRGNRKNSSKTLMEFNKRVCEYIRSAGSKLII